MIKVSTLKLNPHNPRKIEKERVEKLRKSIHDFPKMMALRPLIIDENNVVLGGNMRLQAIKHLGYKEIPDEWVRRAEDLSEEEKREFIIKDNIGFGEWDWDNLLDEWNTDDLVNWGLDIEEPIPPPLMQEKELVPFEQVHILISFHPDQFSQISAIMEQLQQIPDISILHGSN